MVRDTPDFVPGPRSASHPVEDLAHMDRGVLEVDVLPAKGPELPVARANINRDTSNQLTEAQVGNDGRLPSFFTFNGGSVEWVVERTDQGGSTWPRLAEFDDTEMGYAFSYDSVGWLDYSSPDPIQMTMEHENGRSPPLTTPILAESSTGDDSDMLWLLYENHY